MLSSSIINEQWEGIEEYVDAHFRVASAFFPNSRKNLDLARRQSTFLSPILIENRVRMSTKRST